MCRSGAEQKRWRLTEKEQQETTEMSFKAYGKELEAVPSFKYLGQIMTVLASGGGKPGEGAEELGTAETDTEQGRGGQENIGEFSRR